MRKLFLLRGAPGSGKSSWCRENGLSDYVVEPDAIRLMYRAPVLGADGTYSISQKDNKRVWETVKRIVAERMTTGDLTIIDATFAKTGDMSNYKSLAAENRYRVYVVDFTDVPKEVALARNAARMPEYKRVPDYVIERYYNTIKDQEIPASYIKCTPDEALHIICDVEPLDHTGYAASNFIGDIHGCMSALCDLLCGELGCEKDESGNPVLRDDELYVFVGDYIDRGIENADVMNFIMEAACRDNVIVLEGNHEKWLEKWCHNKDIHSNTFRSKTAPQLESANISKKDVSRFYRKCLPFAYVRVADASAECGYADVFCCHGGLSRLPYPFYAISVEQCIKGSGGYPDVETSDHAWEMNEGMEYGTYLVHGHRGHFDGNAHPTPHVFCLETKVEMGGFLSAARFESADVGGKPPREVLVENTVYEYAHEDIDPASTTVAEAVAAMRKNRFIKEKELSGKHAGISSFNFTRDAFIQSAWSTQTVKARGLFIDTRKEQCKNDENDASGKKSEKEDMSVVARSYDKFFNVGEREETQLENLCSTFVFPVRAYLKENGYLGIASARLDENGKAELFCASKSTDEGWFAARFDELLKEELVRNGGVNAIDEFAQTLHHLGVTATFEVIDTIDDRHIVEYDNSHVVLLSLIENSLSFNELPFEKTCEVAEKYGLAHKKLAYVFETPEQLAAWYDNAMKVGFEYEGELVEGFVLADADSNMAKVKCGWYNKWKAARGMVHDVFRRGKSDRIESLVERGWKRRDAEEFYAWLKKFMHDWWHGDNKREEPHVIDVRHAWESREKTND